MAERKQLVCSKCNKSMEEENFYTYKDGSKTELCKKCLTMHIDNFDPSTFLWLLEKMDVPYIPEEWNVLRDKAYAKNPNAMNGMSVFGKYLSKMKLKQWKQYSWADTETLMAESEQKKQAQREAMEELEKDAKERFEKGEISEAEFKTLTSTTVQRESDLVNYKSPNTMDSLITGKAGNPFQQTYISDEDLIDPAADLTKEDKIMLAMKWGRTYSPQDWVELEKKYNEMMQSFDIEDSDTIGTLILICKTYLKMNQAIDREDMESYQKLAKTYDSLRKSAKFTAAQNKEKKDDYADCVGVLVNICEKEGFIPRYVTDVPQDKVDAVLKDNNEYVKKLVTQDLGFGQQIEDALKKIKIQKEMENADPEEELQDSDHEEYYEEIEEQKRQDEELYSSYNEEDDE